jgi:hypothetical protein
MHAERLSALGTAADMLTQLLQCTHDQHATQRKVRSACWLHVWAPGLAECTPLRAPAVELWL